MLNDDSTRLLCQTRSGWHDVNSNAENTVCSSALRTAQGFDPKHLCQDLYVCVWVCVSEREKETLRRMAWLRLERWLSLVEVRCVCVCVCVRTGYCGSVAEWVEQD